MGGVFHIDDMEGRARDLLLMRKNASDVGARYVWPDPGGKLVIDLVSPEERSMRFHLDIHELRRVSTLEVSASELPDRKSSFQNRALTIPLVRVDMASDPSILCHMNPDGEVINGSHVHFYVEGYGARYAVPIDRQDVICPHDMASSTVSERFYAFLDACRIERGLNIEMRLEGV